jgi:hypothetical protein
MYECEGLIALEVDGERVHEHEFILCAPDEPQRHVDVYNCEPYGAIDIDQTAKVMLCSRRGVFFWFKCFVYLLGCENPMTVSAGTSASSYTYIRPDYDLIVTESCRVESIHLWLSEYQDWTWLSQLEYARCKKDWRWPA